MIFRKVISFILMTIGFIGYLFFDKYNGTIIPYPTLWYICSMLLVVLGFFILVQGFWNTTSRYEKQNRKLIRDIMTSGIKLEVDLLKCEIISSTYYKDEPKSKSARVQAWDALYDSSATVKKVEVNRSRISYKTEIEGEKRTFVSEELLKDEITLAFLLEKQKTTFVYLKGDDSGDYYFDLSFLKEH